MLVDPSTANHMIDSAVAAACDGPGTLAAALNHMGAAMYVTDEHGTITYFNDACVALAGRTPAVGRDQWCVTWKLFTLEGEPLPHDQCPMAVAVRERRPIRNAQAVAERPDGTRFAFTPYPSPLFDGQGNFTGAVNLLAETQEFRVEFGNDVASGPVSVTFTANSLGEALEKLASPPVQPVQLWCEGNLLGRLELRAGKNGAFWRLAGSAGGLLSHEQRRTHVLTPYPRWVDALAKLIVRGHERRGGAEVACAASREAVERSQALLAETSLLLGKVGRPRLPKKMRLN